MPAADLPPDEEERLKALRDLEILDTEPEEEFDELVRRPRPTPPARRSR